MAFIGSPQSKHSTADRGAISDTMDLRLNTGRLYCAAVIALSIWFLHGFVNGFRAASVAAIASWPLYARFAARVRRHVGGHVTALIFTAIVTVFVLAPMVFALWALLGEGHTLFREIAAAAERGIAPRRGCEASPCSDAGTAILRLPEPCSAGASKLT